MDNLTERQLLYRRWGALEKERASWWAHWKELSDYLLPRSGRFFVQDRDRGDRRHNNIYDSTGTRAARTLAAGMMSGMTSPARPWFRFSIHDQDMMKSQPVKIWLATATRIVLDIFAKSNTYNALHMMYEELGVFGTGASIVVDDFKDVLRHFPQTIGQYAVATDYSGKVCTIYREYDKTVGEIVKEFGKSRCSTAVQTLFDRGELDQWVTIVHCIEPRADRDPTKRDARNMAWKSSHFELATENNDQMLRESGFKEFPALAPRWQVQGGDIYGNSPGMEALGDVKQLQHEQLRKAQGIDYMTKPPVQAPTSMKSRDIEMMPGGVSFVDTATPSGGIRTAFEVNLNLEHLLGDIQDVRQRIREAFYADLFLMLSSNQDPRMTATEVAERHEEKLLMLGPVVERLQNELLNPMVDLAFSKAMAAGILPPPPPELHGQEINVEYVSVLAQAQRAVATNSVDRFVGNLGQIAQFKPDVLDKFNSDKWADAYADMLGVDPELVVADKDVALVRQQRAKAQQQQAQAEQAQQMSQAAKNLGQTPTQGGGSNAAQDIMGMFSGYGNGQ